MTRQFAVNETRDDSLQRLGQQLFMEWAGGIGSRVPEGPRLILFNPAVPVPEFVPRPSKWPKAELHIAGVETDTALVKDGVAVARANSALLPLQTARLGAVLLIHLVADGKEEVLEEACRTVQPGGFVLILGLNRLGLRHLTDRSGRRLPAISPLAVRARLEELEMNVISTLAAGFLRGDRPGDLNRGPARMLIPLADLFLIVARPVTPKIMTPLAEEKKIRAVGAPSALAGR